MPLKIGEFLVRSNLIDQDQLDKALEEQKQSGGRIGEHLIRLGFVTEEDILDCLSQQYGVPSINLRHFPWSVAPSPAQRALCTPGAPSRAGTTRPESSASAGKPSTRAVKLDFL